MTKDTCYTCGKIPVPSDEVADLELLIVETGELVKTTTEIFDICEEQCRIDLMEFMWTDGNYACDCNRFLFAGKDVDQCSDNKVLARVTWRGHEVYSDFPE